MTLFRLGLAVICIGAVGCTARERGPASQVVMDGGAGNTLDASGGGASCGDGTCAFDKGEGCQVCAMDCADEPTCMGDPQCGDGLCETDRGEGCDSCAADCSKLPICAPGVCGDGKVASDEDCDDGDLDSFDGCSSKCVTEDYYQCEGEPSVCGRPAALAGDFIITEIMADPAAVDDSKGEWVEIRNASPDTLTLHGLAVSNDKFQSFTITSTVLVPPGGYAILANNDDSATNGGVTVDYGYAGLVLNDEGTLTLTQGGTITIDVVKYGVGAASAAEGHSLALDPAKQDHEQNDLWRSWCQATGAGTPGAANPACPPPPPGWSGSESPGVIIPDDDLTGVTRTLVATKAGCVVLSVDVDVDITHTYIGDLTITLSSPKGTKAILHNGTGGTADDIVGNYPYTLASAEPLSIFKGEDPNGTWSLTLVDDFSVYEGTLQSWSLNILCEP
ncbi:MAG: proprotein convertase P-domain-containing protein [Myxococcales bacterium]|nr:proprotein convertase P-domain-containing protein [Myxococcales bacterium]